MVFPLLAVEVGGPAAVGGALLSAFALGALGALGGSLLVASRVPRNGPMRLAFGGIAGLAVAFTAVAFAPSLTVALVLVGFAVGSALTGQVVAAHGVRVGLLGLAAMQVLALLLGLLARRSRERQR